MNELPFSARGCGLLLVQLSIGLSLSFAQTTFEKTYAGYSGSSVQQTSDGGYIVAGSVAGSDDRKSDILLIKTSLAGGTLWTRIYGGPGDDYGSYVQQTSDGGYIIAGVLSYDPGPAEGAVYLVKTNSRGDTLWTGTYGGSWNPPSVQQTFDGGYIITGFTAHIQSGVGSSFLVKTSSTGEMLWRKWFSLPPGQVETFTHAYSVRQTTDGGYIIAGDDRFSVFLLKTDSMGDQLWVK